MPQGGGRGLVKVSRDIVFKILNHISASLPAFFKGKKLAFGKIKCHVTLEGGREGVPRQCHQMTHGGGVSKISPKKCHVLFEWPLIATSVTFLTFLD